MSNQLFINELSDLYALGKTDLNSNLRATYLEKVNAECVKYYLSLGKHEELIDNPFM